MPDSSSFDPVEVTPLHPDQIAARVAEGLAAIAAADALPELAAVRTAHLGDNSPIALARREIGSLPPQAKKDAGKRVNAALGELRTAYEAREQELIEARDAQVLASERIDVSTPPRRRRSGALHPLTAISWRLEDVFIGMGYEVAEGPEVEAEWTNFDALNITADHPARSESDTFFIAPADTGVVLRTHTSPVQVRTMLSRKPPIYVVCPGRTYRTDDLDATHTPVFSQIEGLVVDEGITMAHLRGTLDAFATAMFGEGIITRWRPSFFPFTEPSAELDVRCFTCLGASVGDPQNSCRTCGGEGWIELGGCGWVNPRVLVACGIDPEVYSGFAFGIGIERTLMASYGISDMHDIVEGDVRFSLKLRGEL